MASAAAKWEMPPSSENWEEKEYSGTPEVVKDPPTQSTPAPPAASPKTERRKRYRRRRVERTSEKEGKFKKSFLRVLDWQKTL
jgi:hypothetical protein